MKKFGTISILIITLAITVAALPCASLSVHASEDSINPEKTIYNLFDVYGRYYDYGENEVKVYGVEYNPEAREELDRYQKRGSHQVLPKALYKEIKKLAQAVFRASPGGDSHGSAVHVGGNLILTNHHVLSPSRKNKNECKNFNIRLNPNQDNKTLTCKKVHRCSEALDYCLIEMNDRRPNFFNKKSYSLSTQSPPRLEKSPNISNDTNTIAIGNTMGFGIHASKGKGLSKDFGGLKFYAPVFGGNSGGGLFNENGELIGIVRAQSEDRLSDQAFNVAVDLKLIEADLKRALGEDSSALKQINFGD